MPMPREPSDARAALMAVYLSQRLSFPSSSSIPTTMKKQKPTERPLRRKHYPKTPKMYLCMCKKDLYRRRRDGDESMHPTRANGAGQIGLGETSGGIIRRQRRRNIGGRPGLPASQPPPRTSQGGLTETDIEWVEAEMRRANEAEAKKEARKKGDYTCNLMKQSGDEMLLVDMARVDGGGFAEEVAHADRYFDMYINAEAWVGN